MVVEGSASQAAGASGRGGLLVIHGDASARCGISLKGADIVVARLGRAHERASWPRAGRLVVCGDAGDALGDSLYEARLYVRGVGGRRSAPTASRRRCATSTSTQLRALLARAGIDDVDPAEFRRYGSARTLYNFHVDNVGSY